MPSVALYWDFENVHASLIDAEHGERAYAQRKFSQQATPVDVGAVVAYAKTLGPVTINRAYGNWQWMSGYRFVLQDHALDLVQVFPVKGAKNSADIRIAVDVVDDLHTLHHISHVVIVGGDSDFIPLAQRVRLLGRTIIGIGVEETTSARLVAAVDEFTYYRSLVSTPDPPSTTTSASPPDEGRALLHRGVAQLSLRTDDRWVLKAVIKPFLQRLDPSFDVKTYDCRSFAEFIHRFGDQLEWRKGDHDDECRVPTEAMPEGAGNGETMQRRLVRRYGFPPRLGEIGLPSGLDAIASLIAETSEGLVESFDVLLDGIAGRHEGDASLPGAKALKNLLFKLGVFQLHGRDRGVGLVCPPADLKATVIESLVDTLQEGLLELGPENVARALCSPSDSDATIEELATSLQARAVTKVWVTPEDEPAAEEASAPSQRLSLDPSFRMG